MEVGRVVNLPQEKVNHRRGRPEIAGDEAGDQDGHRLHPGTGEIRSDAELAEGVTGQQARAADGVGAPKSRPPVDRLPKLDATPAAERYATTNATTVYERDDDRAVDQRNEGEPQIVPRAAEDVTVSPAEAVKSVAGFGTDRRVHQRPADRRADQD